MSDALNYQWVLSAPMNSAVYALSGVQRAFLLSALSMIGSFSWVNDNGLPLTQEQRDIAEKIMSDTFEDVSMPIVGMIIASPIELSGFLICDGSTYNTVDYPLLSAALGGVGATFTVPNLRNRFILGASFPKPRRTRGGLEDVTLTQDQMPLHTHTEVTVGFSPIPSGGGAPIPTAVPSAGITGSSGLSQSHTNMPPYETFYWLISAG